MSGAIPPLPQYALMAWWSVKAQGQLYLYRILYCEMWLKSHIHGVCSVLYILISTQVPFLKRIFFLKQEIVMTIRFLLLASLNEYIAMSEMVSVTEFSITDRKRNFMFLAVTTDTCLPLLYAYMNIQFSCPRLLDIIPGTTNLSTPHDNRTEISGN
jgi:hypothetical protein